VQVFGNRAALPTPLFARLHVGSAMLQLSLSILLLILLAGNSMLFWRQRMGQAPKTVVAVAVADVQVTNEAR